MFLRQGRFLLRDKSCLASLYKYSDPHRVKCQGAQKHKWMVLLALTMDYLVLIKDCRTLGWDRSHSVPLCSRALASWPTLMGLAKTGTYLFPKLKL